MAKLTAAQAVAAFLKSIGTRRYYLYNGHANWGLLDALEYEARIPGIRARHELHAIHMADIEWRMRRELPIPVTCTSISPMTTPIEVQTSVIRCRPSARKTTES